MSFEKWATAQSITSRLDLEPDAPAPNFSTQYWAGRFEDQSNSRINWGRERPVYIAVEGVKGVGKGTVLSRLVQVFKECGTPLVTLNPTQAILVSHPLEYLDRALPLRQYNWWREHLYAARSQVHAHDAARQCQEAEEQGNPIRLLLGDRSIYTSLVTRWPEDESAESLNNHYLKVRNLERDIPIPDYVLYMYAPLDVIQERINGRQRSYGQEDEALDQLISAQRAYASLSSPRFPLTFHSQWITIDADRKLEKIVNEVHKIIQQIINVHSNLICE